MTEWTDKHYNFTYKLTEEDVERGEIKIDPYFVGMVWKTGSRDDSGALAHCLKTIARFGDKNPIEREVNALYAQVKGLARVHGVLLENASEDTGADSLWYPDDSGEWVEWSGGSSPVALCTKVEFLTRNERNTRKYSDCLYDARNVVWGHGPCGGLVHECEVVAYKVVEE